MKNSALVVINQTMPTEPFLQDELAFLEKELESHLFVLPTDTPEKVDGSAYNAQVLLNLARTQQQKFLNAMTLGGSFYFKVLSKDNGPKKLRNLFRLAHATASTLFYFKKLNELIIEKKLNQQPLVIYTYWFTPASYAACLLKSKYPHIQVVTRAHGIDLFRARHADSYIPMRAYAGNWPDLICPCSQAGVNELLNCGIDSSRIKLSYLGVPTSSSIAHPSIEGNVSIVSCSNLDKVKRLPLLLKSFFELGKARSGLRIHWHHLGGKGDDLENIKKEAHKLLSGLPQFKYTFHGQLSVHDVRAFYQNNFVDILVNTSSYEGLPVSMMEAGMAGVPILGTDVGGVKELIIKDVGCLLPSDFTSEQFVAGVDQLLLYKNLEKRKVISHWFNKKFERDANYRLFLDEVIHVRFKLSRKLLNNYI